jgi:Anti-sigma-K factor rskA, C-terminal
MTDEEPNGRIDDPDEDRAVAAFLDAIAPTLRDEAVWVEPPAGLADSIIAAIAAERAAGPTEPGPPQPAAVPTTPPVVTPIRRRSRAAWFVGAAAAAAVAALAVGIVVTRGDGESDEEQFAISGTQLAPNAEATAEVNELGAGVAISLDVHDLPPAPAGFYYQGWVRNAEDDSVTVGTFHMRAGDARVTLWSGVDVDEYSTLTVTLQEEGAGPESSGEVVLRGSIAP